jgi:hypothetical protein
MGTLDVIHHLTDPLLDTVDGEDISDLDGDVDPLLYMLDWVAISDSEGDIDPL